MIFSFQPPAAGDDHTHIDIIDACCAKFNKDAKVERITIPMEAMPHPWVSIIFMFSEPEQSYLRISAGICAAI